MTEKRKGRHKTRRKRRKDGREEVRAREKRGKKGGRMVYTKSKQIRIERNKKVK